FGASYSVANGFGLNFGLTESNFLGRGQYVSVNLAFGTDNQNSSITFIEPNFLDRDLEFKLEGRYTTTDNDNARYSTNRASFSPSVEFPVSEYGRLELRYTIARNELFDVSPNSSAILLGEETNGALWNSSLGYTYSFDTRRTGPNPNSGVLLRFSQDFS